MGDPIEEFYHVMRSRYYAASIPELMELMRGAGFKDVVRRDDKFFRPVIAGTKDQRATT